MHLQLFASEPNKLFSTRSVQKESLQDDLFVKKCGRTAQQRGRISLLFLPEKLFLQLVRVRRERERAHYRLHKSLFVLLRPFPCVLQHWLKEQVPKRAYTSRACIFLKMTFYLCVSGCGRYLAPRDGHERCIACLGLAHAEAAFVDESCTHCGMMTISELRSRLQLLQRGGVPVLLPRSNPHQRPVGKPPPPYTLWRCCRSIRPRHWETCTRVVMTHKFITNFVLRRTSRFGRRRLRRGQWAVRCPLWWSRNAISGCVWPTWGIPTKSGSLIPPCPRPASLATRSRTSPSSSRLYRSSLRRLATSCPGGPLLHPLCRRQHLSLLVAEDDPLRLPPLPSDNHSGMPPNLQPVVRPLVSSGRSSPRAGVPACCSLHGCLCYRLGGHVQRAGSVRGVDGPPTALAHQLPRVASSIPCPGPPEGAVTGQACAGPYGQYCDRCVHQPSRRSALPSHVATRPPSPPLESEASEVASRHSCPWCAQPCGQRALTSCAARRVATPPPGGPADLGGVRRGSGRPVCLARNLPLPVVLLPVRGDTRHRCTGAQLAPGPSQVCVSPSEPTCTDLVQSQGGRGVGLASCALLAQPDLVPGTHAPRDSPSLASSSEEGPSSQRRGTLWHPRPDLWKLHVWSLDGTRRY